MIKKAELPCYRHKEIHPVLKFYGEWDGALAAQQLADEMTKRGMIATYNHPYGPECGNQNLSTRKVYGHWRFSIMIQSMKVPLATMRPIGM